jgi:tRNA G10  N-methylase Trm11
MTKSLLILGRQPALGLAELESLFGSQVVTPVGQEAAILDIDAKDIPFHRLGGSIKLTRILASLPTTSWDDIEDYLTTAIPEHLQFVADGKFKLGLSVYGLKINPKHMYATGLRLKKIIKATGRGVRIIPNKSPALNSAQVLHNQLTKPTGWELVFVLNGDKTILCQTYAEQDIDGYAKRDQNRPMRDARVGMLPPKLAQMLINMTNPKKDDLLLDPFCGTGVVLQEAMLMGLKVYGSDLEPRMTEYSLKNLVWLQSTHHTNSNYKVESADATTYTWVGPIDKVVTETYLGKPLSSLPPKHLLDQIHKECDIIHEKFLRNIGAQLNGGTKLCLAVPAWRLKNGFLHLKTLDRLESLGYNRLSFVHAINEDLIYHRESQVVARELVILEKI